MRSKIILSGDRGFIGGNLMDMLSKAYPKKDFIGIDRRGDIEIHNKNVQLFKTDINNWLPTIHNVETVIHLAALPSVRDSEARASDVIFDNILATQKIIHQCINVWKPKKMILTSSSSVYDGRNDEFMNETDVFLRPLSAYANSKLTCEQMVKMYIDNGRLNGIQSIIIRPFTVFGPHQRDELAIQAIIDSCLNDKPFTLYGDGTQKRDFTYIDDTCRAIDALRTNYDLKHTIYNIGTGKNISINEVIGKVSRMIEKPVTINYQPATIYDSQYTKANIERIKRDTNWKPEVEFNDGLIEQIKWQSGKSELK
ncbi:MAG: NAD-dependent epimerase/dehydratase family protein [Actinobacteria bacterium]|nr:NAD-dependent epimerase/dehydratase family protein [Actinomycetota bacterium]MBE3114667.1 NAD-dependent epimerase/dehydratase family protein [Actinomycetota bacterium]